MSFYTTQNLANFTVKDQGLNLTKSVLALKSGIVQPITSTITDNNPVTYTAEQICNGAIIRYGTFGDSITDTWPSASSIISEIESRLKSIVGRDVTIRAGDNFPIVFINNTNESIDMDGGAGVDNDFNTVPSGQARMGQIIITSLSPATIYVDGF